MMLAPPNAGGRSVVSESGAACLHFARVSLSGIHYVMADTSGAE